MIFVAVLLLAIIIYVILYKFLKNRIKSKNYRILTGIFLSCFIAVILYTLSVGAIIYSLSKEEYREFETDQWILVGEDMNKRLSRFEMIDDLIKSEILIKKDSLAIKKILGEPSFRDQYNNKWTYEAGTGGGFGFVDHYLDIYYNKNYEAVKFEHRRIQD